MTSKDRIIVSKTVLLPNSTSCSADDGADASMCRSAADSSKSKSLNLMMISCEENPPYGPSKDTAIMFLELLCQAYERKCSLLSTTVSESMSREHQMANNGDDTILTISITVYHAQSKNDYPLTSSEWSSYDGVLIPGSLSAAYDTHIEWIEKLQSVIRNDIHKMRLKTMGVCFGHQCFAHAFGTHKEDGGREGQAIKCPTAAKAGRISSKLTQEGRQLLLLDGNSDKCNMEMLYTHGDMVHSLPEFAISLGGNANVPIEACAYFSSKEEKSLFQKQQQRQTTTPTNGDDNNIETSTTVRPYAVTFQAHPEYISPTGFNVNYLNTVKVMEDRGYITQQLLEEVCEDARVNFEKVQGDSLDAMIAVATTFGWF